MTWIKICGTTSLRDARLSITAGANALGFIFGDSLRQIEVAAAAAIVAGLADGIETIGVFVNEAPQRVAEIVEQAGLSGVQLHGEETPTQIEEIRRKIGQRRIIKTLQARALLSAGDAELGQYLSPGVGIDAILLDSGSLNQRVGTGKAFAWEEAVPLAEAIRAVRPLIIAGGLNADNVPRALELFAPWGVDVVSGVESESGRKSEAKLHDFIAAVRKAEIVAE
jgi:phosphoribosylanthranilate isomerase